MGVVFGIIIVVPLVVVVIGLLMRIAPRRITDVRFHDTEPSYAAVIVASFAEGTYENRFGYPTGYYVVDDKATRMPSRIVLKEAQPVGSVTDTCAVSTASFGAIGFEDGVLAGCFTLVIAGLISAPFWIVSILDRLYRTLLRSRVTFDLTPDGADTVVVIALAGAGAYLMRSRYEHVFNAPQLPISVRPPAAAPVPLAPPTPFAPPTPLGGAPA